VRESAGCVRLRKNSTQPARHTPGGMLVKGMTGGLREPSGEGIRRTINAIGPDRFGPRDDARQWRTDQQIQM